MINSRQTVCSRGHKNRQSLVSKRLYPKANLEHVVHLRCYHFNVLKTNIVKWGFVDKYEKYISYFL